MSLLEERPPVLCNYSIEFEKHNSVKSMPWLSRFSISCLNMDKLKNGNTVAVDIIAALELNMQDG